MTEMLKERFDETGKDWVTITVLSKSACLGTKSESVNKC
jgi:hypothetical protein